MLTERLHPLAVRHAARNFWLGVANGALFNLSETLIDAGTVLAAFVRLLGGSPLLVGLLFSMNSGLWYLPQLPVSSFMQAWQHKMPLYTLMVVVRSLAWGAMAVLALTVRDPQTLLAAFLAAYFVFRLGGGFSGLSFTEVVAKTVPPRRRGQYFSWRNLTGGLLGMGAGAWVAYMVGTGSPLAFPRNFGALVGVACVLGTIGMVLFCLVVEPPEPPQPRASLGWQLRQAGALVTRQAEYRRYLALRVVLVFGQAALAFFEGYAGRVIGLPAGAIGVYLTASSLAGILVNPVWGRLSEFRGNRVVLRLATAAGAGSVLLVPVTARLRLALGIGLEWCIALLALAFVLARVHISGADVSATPLLLDMAPPEERSLYLGTTNSLVGIAVLASSVAGGAVEIAGYDTVFALSIVCFLATAVLAWRIAEPRAQGLPPPADAMG